MVMVIIVVTAVVIALIIIRAQGGSILPGELGAKRNKMGALSSAQG